MYCKKDDAMLFKFTAAAPGVVDEVIIRILVLKPNANINLAKYLRGKNVHYQAVLYPRDTLAKTISLNTRFNYQADADVTN